MDGYLHLGNPFLWLGILWALFYWWRAVYISVDYDVYKNKKWDWWLHQRFFNAVGVVIGWYAVNSIWHVDVRDYSAENIVVLVIAFLGVTGHLPYAVLLGRLSR